MASKVQEKITYPLPNFNGWVVEVYERTTLYNGGITYSCWNWSRTMLVKGAPGHGWWKFCVLCVNIYFSVSDTFLYIQKNAKIFSVILKDKYLVKCEYDDFGVMINPLRITQVYANACQIDVAPVASSPAGDRPTPVPMQANVKKITLLSISTVIFPQVLIACFFLLFKTLLSFYWNMYAVP